MSLTTFLKRGEIRERFRREFPKPRLVLDDEQPVLLLAPPLTRHYKTVGTGFDYLLRFYVEHLDPEAVTYIWTAWKALQIDFGDRDLSDELADILLEAHERYLQFLKTGSLNDDLIVSTLLLAKIDGIAKNPYGVRFMDESVRVIDERDVDDLRRLISIVDPDSLKARKTCVLSPHFGKASVLMAGAVGDLVIDDMLIEVKTARELRLKREHFNQLVAYYVLSRIGGIEGVPRNRKISRLGLYFARFAYLEAFETRDIIDESQFSNFLEWFEKKGLEFSGIKSLSGISGENAYKRGTIVHNPDEIEGLWPLDLDHDIYIREPAARKSKRGRKKDS